MQGNFAPPPDPGSAQAKLNKRLTHCRRRVEVAFGELKGRWVACIRNVFWNDVELLSKVSAVCCALHNFVVKRGCEFHPRWDVPHPEDVDFLVGPMQVAANEAARACCLVCSNLHVAHLAGE
jgi:hypothetical protein